VPTPILRRIKCRRFRCEVGTALLKIDGIRHHRDKRMSQLWSCAQPTILRLCTVTIFAISVCIDHTAVLSCVGSTVTVALFSQPESCVIAGLRRVVNEICVLLGINAAQKYRRFGENLSVLSSTIKQSILDRKECRSQSESSFK